MGRMVLVFGVLFFASACGGSRSAPERDDAGGDIDVDTDADSDTDSDVDTDTKTGLGVSCGMAEGACVPDAMCSEADRIPEWMGWNCCDGWVCCAPPLGVTCEDLGGECIEGSCPPGSENNDGPLPCSKETQNCCMAQC